MSGPVGIGSERERRERGEREREEEEGKGQLYGCVSIWNPQMGPYKAQQELAEGRQN